MTCYLAGPIARRAVPELPSLDMSQPGPDMQKRARAWLEATKDLRESYDSDTLATERPGVDPAWLLSDWSYAELCAQAGSPAPSPRPLSTPVSRAVGFQVYDGNGVMNTRFLRSGLFGGGAQPGQRLPVLNSHNGDWIQCRGAALGQDHLDVMLAVFRRTSGVYDERLGEEIVFAPYEVCKELGMSDSTVSLSRLSGWVKDLQATVVELHEPKGVDPRHPVSTPLLSNLDSNRKGRVEGRRTLTWSVVVPAPVYASLVASRLFSAIPLDARKALESPFMRWLSAYMATHEPGRILSLNMVALAQAGGLKANPETTNGKRELRRQVRQAFEVLAKGEVRAGRSRVRVEGEGLAQALAQGRELVEVKAGPAKGWYVSAEQVRTFKPLVKVVTPPGNHNPDYIAVMRAGGQG